MKTIEVDTIGAYVIFFYDFDEYADLIIVDEIWRSSFDECLKDVCFMWGLPFEICQCIKPLRGLKGYKTVARSSCYAEIYG